MVTRRMIQVNVEIGRYFNPPKAFFRVCALIGDKPLIHSKTTTSGSGMSIGSTVESIDCFSLEGATTKEKQLCLKRDSKVSPIRYVCRLI